MSNKERTELEKQLEEDFELLPQPVQAYLQEETLEPQEVLTGDYAAKPIRERAGIIDRAEKRASEMCGNSSDLVNAQSYLLSVSQYLFEGANLNVEMELARR